MTKYQFFHQYQIGLGNPKVQELGMVLKHAQLPIPTKSKPLNENVFAFLQDEHFQNPSVLQGAADLFYGSKGHCQVLSHCVHMVDQNCAYAQALHKADGIFAEHQKWKRTPFLLSWLWHCPTRFHPYGRETASTLHASKIVLEQPGET
nr:hypothetical protein Iba_chr01aCG20390 [Ipomoea batatas]